MMIHHNVVGDYDEVLTHSTISTQLTHTREAYNVASKLHDDDLS